MKLHGLNDLKRRRIQASGCALLLALVAARWALTAGAGGVLPAIEPPPLPVDLTNVPRLGQLTAPVAVVEFADFQCPFCRRLATDVLPVLEHRFVSQGQVMLGFRHLVSPGHPLALQAAEIAECARTADRFWPLYRALFARADGLTAAAIRDGLQEAGIDRMQLSSCELDDADRRVQRDMDEARRLGITATPTLLVGVVTAAGRLQVTEILVGLQSARAVGDAIERALRSSER
jgi:protein-disulfide isomerase